MPKGWRYESHRHALAARSIPTIHDTSLKLEKNAEWILFEDAYELRTDPSDPSTAFAEVFMTDHNTWIGDPHMPGVMPEEFDDLEDAQDFIIMKYATMYLRMMQGKK